MNVHSQGQYSNSLSLIPSPSGFKRGREGDKGNENEGKWNYDYNPEPHKIQKIYDPEEEDIIMFKILDEEEELLSWYMARDGDLQDEDFETIHKVIRHTNNFDEISSLVASGVNVDMLTKKGHTGLHMAVMLRKIGFIHHLLDLGADVEHKTVTGDTPLLLIVRSHSVRVDPEIVRCLIQRGADTNVIDKEGQTPRAIAMGRYQKALRNYPAGDFIPKFDILKFFLCDDWGLEPIHLAVYFRCALEVSTLRGSGIELGTLIDSGVDVNKRTKGGKCGNQSNTPLHFAACNNPKDCELLINAGANMDLKNVDGDTPLHLSVRAGRLSTCRVLVDAGANVELTNNDGDTPLHLAVKYRSNSFVACLVHNGADNKCDAEGKTPKFIAQESFAKTPDIVSKRRVDLFYGVRFGQDPPPMPSSAYIESYGDDREVRDGDEEYIDEYWRYYYKDVIRGKLYRIKPNGELVERGKLAIKSLI